MLDIKKIPVFAIFVFLLFSCCKKSTVVSVYPVSAETSFVDTLSRLESIEQSDQEASIYKEDCHGVRKVIRNIKNAPGEILIIGDRFLITTDEGSRRYNPCELDEAFQQQGLKVLFSGDKLEIFTGERLMGSPFRLTDIQKVQ